MSARGLIVAAALVGATAGWCPGVATARPADAAADRARDMATLATSKDSALIATALRSTDLARSVAFYTKGFGMTVSSEISHGAVREISLKFGGDVLAPGVLLFADETPGKASPPIVYGTGFARVILRVPDVEALATRLRAGGYPIERGPIDAGTVKVLSARDPDGYAFEIVQFVAPKR